MSSQGQSYGASLYSEIGAILNDIIARPAIIVDPIQLMSQAIAGVGNTPTVSVSSGINLPIPIFPTDYKEIYPSSCSQQLIVNVNNGTKQYIVDNIAIGPRSWQITGYLCSAQAFLSALVGGVLPGIGTGQASLLTAIPALGAASQALGSVAQF